MRNIAPQNILTHPSGHSCRWFTGTVKWRPCLTGRSPVPGVKPNHHRPLEEGDGLRQGGRGPQNSYTPTGRTVEPQSSLLDRRAIMEYRVCSSMLVPFVTMHILQDKHRLATRAEMQSGSSSAARWIIADRMKNYDILTIDMNIVWLWGVGFGGTFWDDGSHPMDFAPFSEGTFSHRTERGKRQFQMNNNCWQPYFIKATLKFEVQGKHQHFRNIRMWCFLENHGPAAKVKQVSAGSKHHPYVSIPQLPMKFPLPKSGSQCRRHGAMKITKITRAVIVLWIFGPFSLVNGGRRSFSFRWAGWVSSCI